MAKWPGVYRGVFKKITGKSGPLLKKCFNQAKDASGQRIFKTKSPGQILRVAKGKQRKKS